MGIVVVDVESCAGPDRPAGAKGTHPATDRIIQIAMLTIADGAVAERWSSFVDPGLPVDEASSRIHGLTTVDLLLAPSWQYVAPEVARRTAEAHLLGYNVLGYDAEVIAAELRRAGLEPGWRGVVDLQPLVRVIDRHERSYRLTDVAARWGVTGPSGLAHDARYDTELTWCVWVEARRRDSRQFSDDLDRQAEHCAKLDARQRARRAENVGRRG